jgi:hypothetical protein
MTNCRKCGAEIKAPEKGGGRPRKDCILCSPPKTPRKPPNSMPLSPEPSTVTPATAEDIAPGIQVWTSADERREAKRSI